MFALGGRGGANIFDHVKKRRGGISGASPELSPRGNICAAASVAGVHPAALQQLGVPSEGLLEGLLVDGHGEDHRRLQPEGDEGGLGGGPLKAKLLGVPGGLAGASKFADHPSRDGSGGGLSDDGSWQDSARGAFFGKGHNADLEKTCGLASVASSPGREHNIWLHIFLTLESASSSRLAGKVHKLQIVVIALSIISFILQTEPRLAGYEHMWKFQVVEIICTFCFTMEYALHVVSYYFVYGNAWDLMLKPMKIFDLLATLPYYFELLLAAQDEQNIAALKLLRIVRLTRLFRVLKLGKYSKGVKLIYVVIKDSAETLLVLFFLLFMVVLCFSSVIYYVEKMNCPDRSKLSPARLQQYLTDCETQPWSRLDEQSTWDVDTR
ncbi:unnamed protein product [Amoebophrya sp. A25]|nr:unnamed protein product [Amoebophrya sp. A25]|eukprot:GSA25T00025427001.1